MANENPQTCRTDWTRESAPTLTTDRFSTVYPEALVDMEVSPLEFHTTDGAGAPNAVQARLTVLWTSTDTSSGYISMAGGIASTRECHKLRCKFYCLWAYSELRY